MSMKDGCVYAVEFDNSTIKVGHGFDPQARIKQHETTARLHQVDVIRSWASSPHPDSWDTETRLIKWCTDNGRLAGGREYFAGLHLERVVAAAEEIIATPRPTDPHAAARTEAWLAGMKRAFLGISPQQVAEERAAMQSLLDATDEEISAFRHWQARKSWVRRKTDRRSAAIEEKAYLAQLAH